MMMGSMEEVIWMASVRFRDTQRDMLALSRCSLSIRCATKYRIHDARDHRRASLAVIPYVIQCISYLSQPRGKS
jgi:hypothetical protein